MSANRRTRILLAYVTSIGSKVASGLIPVLALPLAAHSLGGERFGVLMMLVAFNSFGTIASQGLSSAVSYGIAHAIGAEDRTAECAEFWATVSLSAVLALSTGSIGLILALTIDPATLLGPNVAPYSNEAFWGLFLVVANLVIFALFGWADGLRAGYRENHVTNLFSTVGALCALGVSVGVYYVAPSVPAFFFSFLMIPLLVQSVSLALVVLRRRYLLEAFQTGGPAIRQVSHRAMGYSLGQIGSNLKFHGTTILSGRYLGLEASALFGVSTRVTFLLFGGVLGLLLPIMPTLSEALSRGDRQWLRQAVRYAIAVSMGCGFVIGLALAIFGDWGFNRWFGVQAPPDVVFFCAIGLMAFLYTAAQGQFLALIALGMGPWGGRRMLVEGLVGFAMAFVAVQVSGLNAVVLAQCAVFVIFTAVVFPVRLLKFARG
jgi:O-antigen/teichoic acid export membrane protein